MRKREIITALIGLVDLWNEYAENNTSAGQRDAWGEAAAQLQGLLTQHWEGATPPEGMDGAEPDLTVYDEVPQWLEATAAAGAKRTGPLRLEPWQMQVFGMLNKPTTVLAAEVQVQRPNGEYSTAIDFYEIARHITTLIEANRLHDVRLGSLESRVTSTQDNITRLQHRRPKKSKRRTAYWCDDCEDWHEDNT